MLEVTDEEFFNPMIKMLKALIETADSIQEQMNNVSRKMEILRKNKKQMLEFGNTVPEMKNAFDGLISRLGMAEERISELVDTTVETSKTGSKEETKPEKNQNRISRNSGTITEGEHMHNENTRRKRQKGTEATFEATVTENCPKLVSDTKLQI